MAAEARVESPIVAADELLRSATEDSIPTWFIPWARAFLRSCYAAEHAPPPAAANSNKAAKRPGAFHRGVLLAAAAIAFITVVIIIVSASLR